MLELFDAFVPELPDATIKYYPHFLKPQEADRLFELLKNETPWRNDPITVFGKTYPQPRMTSLHGHTTDPYGYSGIVMQPNPMNDTLLEIEKKLKAFTDETFTTVLVNLYRDGQDSMGWHRDNEPEIDQASIASLSLGASRTFKVRDRQTKAVVNIDLHHGDLLVMEHLQEVHEHSVPKRTKVSAPRMNFTFRRLV